jgi:hypothetical protein
VRKAVGIEQVLGSVGTPGLTHPRGNLAAGTQPQTSLVVKQKGDDR